MLKYSCFNSMPTKLRFKFTQATPVEPLPIQLSRTVSPSFVYVFMRYSNSGIGFCVGCFVALSVFPNNAPFQFEKWITSCGYRSPVLKNKYVLVCFQRHFVCIVKSCFLCLFPHDFISEHLLVALYQVTCEWLN